MSLLKKRDIGSAVVCSHSFEQLATTQSRVFGVPDLPLVFIPHPLGGLALADVQRRANEAIPQVLRFIQEFVQ